MLNFIAKSKLSKVNAESSNSKIKYIFDETNAQPI